MPGRQSGDGRRQKGGGTQQKEKREWSPSATPCHLSSRWRGDGRRGARGYRVKWFSHFPDMHGPSLYLVPCPSSSTSPAFLPITACSKQACQHASSAAQDRHTDTHPRLEQRQTTLSDPNFPRRLMALNFWAASWELELGAGERAREREEWRRMSQS